MMYKFYVKSSLLLMTLLMFKLSVFGQEMTREFEPPYRLKDLYQFSVDEIWSVVDGVVYARNGDYKVIKSQEISKQDLNAIYFADEKTIFVVGDDEEILVSEDRGKSWKKQEVTDECCTYHAKQKIYLVSVFCRNRYKCWAVGIGEYKDGMRSSFLLRGGVEYKWMRKGGIDRRWARKRMVYDRRLTDVYFATESIGYIVGEEGLLLKTEDGGESWKRIGVPVGKYVVENNSIPDFNAVVFVDEEKGCIVGYRTISCTQDGGKKWKTTYMDGTSYLDDGTYGFVGLFFEKDTIIAVSKYGNHFWSEDFGKTWIECYKGCGISTLLVPIH